MNKRYLSAGVILLCLCIFSLTVAAQAPIWPPPQNPDEMPPPPEMPAPPPEAGVPGEAPVTVPEAPRQTFAELLAELTAAQEKPLPDWQAERQEIVKEGRKRTMRKVTERQAATVLGIRYPVPRTTVAPEDVPAAVQAAIDSKVNEKFPEQVPTEQFQEEAKAAVKQWKVGDEVEFDTKNRRFPHVKGRINAIYEHQIAIGYFKINRTDVSEDVWAQVDPDKVADLRKDYVLEKVREYKATRFKYENKVRPEVTAKVYTDAGYKLVDEEWQPKEKLVAQQLLRMRREAFPEVMKEVLNEKNYVQFDEEWMPEERAFFLETLQKAQKIDKLERRADVLEAVVRKRSHSPYAGLARTYRDWTMKEIAQQEPQF
jgi:hypothetical protein